MDDLEKLLGNKENKGAYLDLLDSFPTQHNSFTPEQIREREKYGIAPSDLKNPLQYINYLYASYFRQIKTIEANVMLDCLINVNEYLVENTVADYQNLHQLKILSAIHLIEFGELYVEAMKIWPKLYTSLFITEEKLDEFQIIQIVDKLIVGNTEKWLWDDAKSMLPDPTNVSSRNYAAHIKQRGTQGYSSWDAEHFPDYIHWIVMQSVIFLMSKNALGIPLRYSEKPFYWDDILRSFLEGMIYGTYAEHMSPEQKTIYETSIINMLDIYPDFIQ